MKTIPTAITVLPAREAIHSEIATTISIDDDGGGPFVVVEQMFESCKELESAS